MSKWDKFAWMRDLGASNLLFPAKVAGLGLHFYADLDGTNAFPGDARMAQLAGVSEKTISRGRDQLEDLGWIKQVSRHDPAKKLSAEYRLVRGGRQRDGESVPDSESSATGQRVHQYRTQGPVTNHAPTTTNQLQKEDQDMNPHQAISEREEARRAAAAQKNRQRVIAWLEAGEPEPKGWLIGLVKNEALVEECRRALANVPSFDEAELAPSV